MKKLQDRLALITGANRGIGLAVSRLYAAEGARCVLAGRDKAALEKTAKEIGGAEVLVMNLGNSDSVREATKAFSAKHPKLDVLVANAAILGQRKPVAQDTLENWTSVFQANVHASLLLLQGLDGVLRKSDAGRVVMLSSGAARNPRAGGSAYAASKAAQDMLALCYAQELAGSPVKLNIVNPGPTRTTMRAQVMPNEDPMTLKTPGDIAPLFVELGMAACAKHGEWITADEWMKGRK